MTPLFNKAAQYDQIAAYEGVYCLTEHSDDVTSARTPTVQFQGNCWQLAALLD